MSSWQQVLATWPFLQTLLDWLAIMLPFAALLAYAGIFFISATAKIISVSSGRSVYNKCSRQTALAGLILGWLLLAGSRVWIYLNRQEFNPEALEGFMIEMSWLLLSLGVLFSSIYYCLWRILKNMPVLHSTIGVISAIQNCIGLAVSLFTIRLIYALSLARDSKFALPDLFPEDWNSPVWSAAAYAAPLLIALAGGASAFWLVLRRKKDDFGRDYYNRFIPWCAAWARNAWALLWLLLVISTSLGIWLQTKAGTFTNDEAMLDIASLLLWFIPLLLWTLVMRSAVPMRHVWAIAAALVMGCAFVTPWFLEFMLPVGAPLY